MTTPHSSTDDYEVVRQFLHGGGSVWMLTDIRQEDLKTLYAYATQLYEAGDFESARNIYLVLVRVDHWNFDYWFALGVVQQRLADQASALFCFSRAGTIRIDDPRASFFAGMSYRSVGNDAYARKAFGAAIRWCGSQPRFADLRRLAEEQLAGCEK